MSTPSFTVRGARENFRQVLDSAQDAHPSTVIRNGHEFAVVDKTPLLHFLKESTRPTARVTVEDDAYVITLEGLPFASEANSLDEAISLLLEDLREYGQDWARVYQNAPNHVNNWGLVSVINMVNDTDLRAWIIGS